MRDNTAARKGPALWAMWWTWWMWWAIFIVAFVLRLGAGVVTGKLWHPELNEYDDIAKAMLAGRGFTFHHLGIVYHSFAAPMFSWICAAVYWLTGGSILLIMLLQIAAGSATAVVAAAISDQLFRNRTAALVAGLLVAVHPGLVHYSSAKAHPLTFDALFFTLVLWQFMRLHGHATLGRAMALGAVVGAGALSRATTLVFFPMGALWLLAVVRGEERRRVFGLLSVAGLCVIAFVAPWTIRNAVVLHRFVPIQTTDGESFWRGNNPYATGHSYIDADHLVIDALPPDVRRDLRSRPDELAQSQWFQDRAIAYITQHPDAFIRLTMLKFFHFWWFAPQTGVLYPAVWLRMYQAYYAAILVLAAIGGWTLIQTGGAARYQGLLLGLFLLALSGLQSLYYVEGRHRWAVEPMVLAVSAGGAAALLARRRAFGMADRLAAPARR